MLLYKNNELQKAVFILLLFTILFYSYVVFLNHSLNPTFYTLTNPPLDPKKYFGCEERDCVLYHWTIDPAADGDAIWPVAKLAATMYSQGILPLWNPYLAAGTPLAADSVNFAFSPFMIFFLLPSVLWDIQLLSLIFLAGFFIFIFLSCWNLKFKSKITASLIFMFSGAFTWYLPHDSVLVTIFTPLILFNIEKIIQTGDKKYGIFGAFTFLLSILGTHLESIVLVIFLSLLYFVFRLITLRANVINSHPFLSNSKKKIIPLFILMISGGILLSSFLIFPIYEYFENGGELDHDTTTGLLSLPYFTGTTPFIPYLLGPLNSSISPSMSETPFWYIMGGYVGTTSLVLSLIAISAIIRKKHNNWHIVVFFLSISIIFILKSINFPIVNLIGHLPILNYVIFPRYDGFIWSLGFAVVSAFCIEFFQEKKIMTRDIIIGSLVSGIVILTSFLLVMPFFEWSNVGTYFTIQISQSLFIILVSFVVLLLYNKNRSSIFPIISVLSLELSLYIPLGLDPLWQFYRSISVNLGILTIMIICLIHSKRWVDNKQKKQLMAFAIIEVLVIISQLVIFEISPMGLPLKVDPYEENSLTKSLNENLNTHRIIMLDTAFYPNLHAAYKIQTLGIISAQNIAWFNSFIHDILDPDAIKHTFDYKPSISWRQSDSLPFEFYFEKNIDYYSFMGIKYIISSNRLPSSALKIPHNVWLSIGESKIYQNFESPIENITSIGVMLGTEGRYNTGNVTLMIDSIPYQKEMHRESSIKAENVVNEEFNFFNFKKPLSDVKEKKFILGLQFSSYNFTNDIAVGINTKDLDSDSYNLIGDKLLINNSSFQGILSILIPSEKFPLVFNENNIHVFENKDVFPRAFLVTKYQLADSFQRAQEMIKDPDFDLRNEIVIEDTLYDDQNNQLQSSTISSDSMTNIVSYEPNKVVINTYNDDASLLVLTDTYYPGWKAYVDGKQTEIYRADGLVRAVFVPQGNHEVKFSYMPESFLLGVIVSIITFVFLIFILIKYRSKNI